MDKWQRVVGIIQARMNSTRLPGKVLMPLAGAPLLQRLVERVRGARSMDFLVVATSNGAADDPIAALCAQIGVPCHRGSEVDVLGRILNAAEQERADVVVRLTADNAFVDAKLVDLVVDEFVFATPPVDYAHNIGESGFAYGLYVEVVAMRALRAAAASSEPDDREHVTWYVRRHPDIFKHRCVMAARRFPSVRLSIDTAADYRRLSAVFEQLYAVDPAFACTVLAENVLARTLR